MARARFDQREKADMLRSDHRGKTGYVDQQSRLRTAASGAPNHHERPATITSRHDNQEAENIYVRDEQTLVFQFSGRMRDSISHKSFSTVHIVLRPNAFFADHYDDSRHDMSDS